MTQRLTRSCCCAIVQVGLVASLLPAQNDPQIRFNEQVRPILSQNCFPCHGLDTGRRKADLRLDVEAGATAELGGKFPIKRGDPANSEVWRRIISDDPDLVMPPQDSKKSLTASEREVIRRWIEQGAVFQKHWAFEPPTRRPPPQDLNQNPDSTSSIKTPVDRFILDRLAALAAKSNFERPGAQPPIGSVRIQPEADRETLIRRVSLALTGLPPTTQQVDEYLQDGSAQAYENMVERFLASRHFGEEMARHWLDIARYADTHGMHLDNERQMWAYRDWVVRAFNDNLPFSEFTRWQLAGDLLPNASPDQLTATGFNRCNVTTGEGGSIVKEFEYRYAVDRTATMIETWMGLTGGCAVCHDHKFDPISMKEFYSLYAFFNNAADPAMDGNINVTRPFVRLPTTDQQAIHDAAAKLEAEARARLESAIATLDYTDPAKRLEATSVPTTPGEIPDADSNSTCTDLILDDFFPLGAVTRNTSRNAPHWDLDPTFGAPTGRRVLRQTNGYFHENIIQPQLTPLRIPTSAVFRVWVRPDAKYAPGGLAIVIASGGGNRRLVWGDSSTFDVADKAYDKDKDNRSIDKGPTPPPAQWTQLEFSADEIHLKEGQIVTSISLQQTGGIVWWDGLSVTGICDPTIDPRASFQAWWKSQAGKSPPDVPEALKEILKAGPEKDHAPELIKKLRDFYLAWIARPTSTEIRQLRSEWEQLRAAQLAAEEAIDGTFVYRDQDSPRESFIMMRGQYDKPGDRVEPGTPSVFPPLKLVSPSARPTRLDLANWLLSADHPLTARVAVNRFWQQFFGNGLVATSSDFGSQGELPTHPELLDWLATEFRESGWDVKGLVRLLINSATFRQSSACGTEVRQRDPANRYYSRGPRLRLDAEQIRDNALFVSGLINLEMGGRGVRPYQPPNIWEPVGYNDSNTRYYLQDTGQAIYRRSLYCFLKRTAPPPFMSNFDGPNREQPCARRERSNTPLQALQLMNDVQHFEAARNLAERTLDERAQKSDDERIRFLYRTVLARFPNHYELQRVLKALSSQRELFGSDPAAAAQAIHFGESRPKKIDNPVETASWTMIANMILNLDETVTRN